MGLLSALIAPGMAAAQADELTQREFDRLIDDATADDPLYGPEEGELELDGGKGAIAFADLEAADFVAAVKFQNPWAGTRQQFDYGVQFRLTDDASLLFALISDGRWALVGEGDEPLASGAYDDVDASRSGENTVTVYAEGSLVHLAINGDYVGSAEVENDGEGRIAVASGILDDSQKAGGVATFADFTVWELGGSSSGKSGKSSDKGDSGSLGRKNDTKSTDKGSKDDSGTTKDSGSKKDDTKNSGGKKKPKGTTYESPTYGYTLTYDKTWESKGDSTSSGIDSLVLSEENSELKIYGIPAGRSATDCRDALINVYDKTLEDSGITAEFDNAGEGTIEAGNRQGAEWTNVLVTLQTDQGSANIVVYFECGPVDGSDYMVGVQHTIFAELEASIEKRDAVINTLAQAGAADEDVPSNTTDEPKTKDEKPTTTKTSSPNVSKGDEGRLVYVSPTYGFTVEVLKGWTIEEDSVRNGYDTLVVSSDTARVTVSGFASSGTAVRCIDSIITNLQNDPNLTNVGVGVQPDGSDSRWDTEGQSEMVVFFTAGGVDYARYYACFEGNDGQSMLVFAYEALEKDIKTEFENIQTMLDLIRVP
jgi:hypothetical protein